MSSRNRLVALLLTLAYATIPASAEYIPPAAGNPLLPVGFGQSGQTIVTDGVASTHWGSPSASGIQRTIIAKTSTYNIAVGDDAIAFLVSAPANGAMPALSGVTQGKLYTVKNKGASTANVTVTVQSGDTIDGTLNGSYVILPGDSLSFSYDGTEWIGL